MIKLIRCVLVIILVFLYANSFAQDAKEKVNIEYGGKVLSKKSKDILQNVIVIYSDPKTGEVSGTVTDVKGVFLIKVPKTVPYLTFSLKGMKKKKLILSTLDSTQYMNLKIFLEEKNQ
jgi:hypothetical protein